MAAALGFAVACQQRGPEGEPVGTTVASATETRPSTDPVYPADEPQLGPGRYEPPPWRPGAGALAAAHEELRRTRRPFVVYYYQRPCPECGAVVTGLLSDPRVRELLRDVEKVRIDASGSAAEAEVVRWSLVERFPQLRVVSLPGRDGGGPPTVESAARLFSYQYGRQDLVTAEELVAQLGSFGVGRSEVDPRAGNDP
ncbi:thioredoxin family protein [bacterium]|nr:thioredoxin family protein [bacterium]